MANDERANASHRYVVSQDVKLKEYFNDLLDALDKRIDERLISMEKANSIRFDGQDKLLRFVIDANDKAHTSMNEFRTVINDQAKSFITRNDHDLLINNTEKDIDELRDDIESLKLTRAELAGKASQGQLYVATAISLLALLTGIIGIVFRLMGK